MILIPITYEKHNVSINIKYATSDNFTGKPIYSRPGCYLRKEAETLLKRAIRLAKVQGWHFLIFDAFRPSEAQFKLWQHSPNPDFLANPSIGSPHSRGIAVDLTLVDTATNKPLDMGTNFDTFSEASFHGSTKISSEAQENRYRLLGIMTSAGWDCYLNEWWHYQLFDSRSYEILPDSDLRESMIS